MQNSSTKPYKVRLEAEQNPSPWMIVEETTQQVIMKFGDSRHAKIRANCFNGGIGFRGWTPAYFLERIGA